MNLTLIDTSSWIEALRPNGDQAVRRRVQALVNDDSAAWCHPVRLELWNYRSGEQEEKQIQKFEEFVPVLAITSAVWNLSILLGRKARHKGLALPAVDLIIAACAIEHDAPIESKDSHFELLLKLK